MPDTPLPIPAEVVSAKAGIDRYFGRDVILGIRPSDFEDASLADPSWARMTAVADVTEPLGTEIHVIFAIGAPPVQHKDTRALADDAGTDDSAIPLAEGKSLWTARVSARSRITAGSPIELSVDTANLHFFDPDNGLAIGHPQNAQAGS